MAKYPQYMPRNYERLVVVRSLKDLFAERMNGLVNCIMMPRRLEGDFDGLAVKLHRQFGSAEYTGVSSHNLIAFRKNHKLKPKQRIALDTILDDMRSVGRDGGWQEMGLRIIETQDYEKSVVRFHQDGLTERLLCAYNRHATRFIRNDKQMTSVQYGDQVRFEPHKKTRIFKFHVGDVSRQAGLYAGDPADAFIHAGPKQKKGEPPRLLLVATRV